MRTEMDALLERVREVLARITKLEAYQASIQNSLKESAKAHLGSER